MRDFRTILKKLKVYLSQESVDAKVYDKKVADALGISPINLATLKRRNSTPYEQIINFCHKEDICCHEVFFES